MVKKLSISIGLAVLGVLLLASPALAIADPDTLTIHSVFAYQHCLEADDQLYLIEFTIDYTSNPDENATEAFIGRLMNGSTELGSTVPYAFYDSGYDRGVMAIYFSATDAPTWEGSYTATIIGNPMLSWAGDPPSTSVATFDSWSDSTGIETTQNELASRVLYLASTLETAWSVDMVESSSTGSYLTSYGEAYFTSIVDNMQSMAPGAFSGSSVMPDWDSSDKGDSYADTLAASVTDTPFDMSEIATDWGLSTMWTSTIFFVIAAIALLYVVARYSGSLRPVVIFAVPMIVGGALLGVIPLVLAIILGFGALVFTGFVLFYHPSGA